MYSHAYEWETLGKGYTDFLSLPLQTQHVTLMYFLFHFYHHSSQPDATQASSHRAECILATRSCSAPYGAMCE